MVVLCTTCLQTNLIQEYKSLHDKSAFNIVVHPAFETYSCTVENNTILNDS